LAAASLDGARCRVDALEERAESQRDGVNVVSRVLAEGGPDRGIANSGARRRSGSLPGSCPQGRQYAAPRPCRAPRQ
jgi:hypothetical protein